MGRLLIPCTRRTVRFGCRDLCLQTCTFCTFTHAAIVSLFCVLGSTHALHHIARGLGPICSTHPSTHTPPLRSRRALPDPHKPSDSTLADAHWLLSLPQALYLSTARMAPVSDPKIDHAVSLVHRPPTVRSAPQIG